MSDAEHGQEPHASHSKGWADSPAFRRAFTWGLYLACLLAGVAGFVWKKDHPHFEAERLPVFFAVYGFVMFALIVLVGQHLRKLVARPENYYDDERE